MIGWLRRRWRVTRDAAVTAAREDAKGNVVNFTPKREYVWTHDPRCCGSQTFWLHRDGSIQCAECLTRIDSLTWGHVGPKAAS
jgi:hypothetical protein